MKTHYYSTQKDQFLLTSLLCSKRPFCSNNFELYKHMHKRDSHEVICLLYVQLIPLRLTSTIVKCAIWSIECQKNDDSLHANVKKYHTRYYICNPPRLLMYWSYIKLYYYHHFFTLMHIAHLTIVDVNLNWNSCILDCTKSTK